MQSAYDLKIVIALSLKLKIMISSNELTLYGISEVGYTSRPLLDWYAFDGFGDILYYSDCQHKNDKKIMTIFTTTFYHQSIYVLI